MKITKLFNNERVNGFSHWVELDYTDLQTAALTKALVLATIQAGSIVRNVAWKLTENFVGTGVTALTLEVGHDLASGTDDPDAFITSKSVLNGVAPIAYATGDGAGLVTSGGTVVQVSAEIELLATAVGANLSLLTAGKLSILLDIVELAEIARPYEPE